MVTTSNWCSLGPREESRATSVRFFLQLTFDQADLWSTSSYDDLHPGWNFAGRIERKAHMTFDRTTYLSVRPFNRNDKMSTAHTSSTEILEDFVPASIDTTRTTMDGLVDELDESRTTS